LREHRHRNPAFAARCGRFRSAHEALSRTGWCDYRGCSRNARRMSSSARESEHFERVPSGGPDQ
jgi:hypothetical protein